jgi:hypothetical protein
MSFFFYLFLQRLPREIRVLLSEKDPTNMRAMADKAEVMHSLQAHDMATVAALPHLELESDDEAVAAAVKAGHKKYKKKQRNYNKSETKASKQSAMCFYRASCWERAPICRDTCSWSEN